MLISMERSTMGDARVCMSNMKPDEELKLANDVESCLSSDTELALTASALVHQRRVCLPGRSARDMSSIEPPLPK